MSAIETRLAELGITLPTPAKPVANYVPSVQSGNILGTASAHHDAIWIFHT